MRADPRQATVRPTVWEEVGAGASDGRSLVLFRSQKYSLGETLPASVVLVAGPRAALQGRLSAWHSGGGRHQPEWWRASFE